MTTQPQKYSHHAASVAGEIAEAGALAGLVGGLAMAAFACVYAAIFGLGFWTPTKAIAATMFGLDMFAAGASAALIGIAIHVALSMTLGIAFALATPREVGPAPAVAFGLGAGVAILILMNLVVLPIVNPNFGFHLMWGSAPGTPFENQEPVGVAFAMHLIFGGGLALAPGLRRRFSAT